LNAAQAPRRRRGLLGPAVAAVAAFAVLIGLGFWQLERKAWKEDLIDAIGRKLAAAPVDLPPASEWARLDRGEWEFRRVRVTGELENDREALVYTTGSTLRADTSGPGYWVFTPAQTRDGLVPVDRGFVPLDRKDVATRIAGQRSVPVEIVGVLRWPDARSWFTPNDDPAKNIWFVRDPVAIAAGNHWGPAPPFYVEQEAPVPPGGLPAPGNLVPNLPNNHLQYAITWFGLAAVLAGVFAVFAWGQVREQRDQVPRAGSI
jgi:surfeit locus 1 family protein